MAPSKRAVGRKGVKGTGRLVAPSLRGRRRRESSSLPGILDDVLAQVQEQLDTAVCRWRDLKQQVEELERERADWEDRLLGELTSKLEGSQGREAELRQKLEESHGREAELRQKLGATTAEQVTLRQRLTELEDRPQRPVPRPSPAQLAKEAELHEALEVSHRECDGLLARLEELEPERTELLEATAQLREERARLEGARQLEAELRDRLEATQTDREELRARLDELERGRTELLSQARAEQQERILRLTEASVRQEEVHRLESELRERLTALGERGSQQATSGGGDPEALDALLRERDELRRQLDRLERERTEIEDEFEIRGTLGEGAMAEVFEAHQTFLARDVALKVIKREVWAKPEERDRVLREAQACRLIQSPHVVNVYDVRLLGGRACVVMELVRGVDAYRRLKSVGKLDIAEILKIGEDVARALSAAAEAGFAHRDLKPHNILLDRAGIAKLADFGIARDFSSHSHLTRPGLGLGSLNYAAPEQLTNAAEADARSDIYGLGATLYHLVAGRPPFVARSQSEMLEVLEQVQSSPPPMLARLRTDCPKNLAKLIHEMLEKNPDDRPQHPSEVAARLQKLRTRNYPGYSVDWSRLGAD